MTKSTDWRPIPVTEAQAGPLAKASLLITNAAEILTCRPGPGNPAGRLENAVIALEGQYISAVGPLAEVERQVDISAAAVLDAGRQIVAPGFIDSHTHLVFGGSRAEEYGLRMTHTAEQVQAMGLASGIPATVAMTRAASTPALEASGLGRLDRMMRQGTTTVESKSGYGLNLADELRLLEANASLQARHPLDVISTFLGAHDFPPEMSAEAYIDLLVETVIPQVAAAGLAQFCDVYCDDGYYSVAQSRRILEAGLAVGLLPKIHTEAYSDIGGAALAAELPVVSADHLNYASPEALRKLGQAGVTAVLMPALDFAVKHPRPFNGRFMLDSGLTVALATDFCPACWVESMQLVMALACRLYAFSPEEALLAATVGGAAALNLNDRGAIAPGMLADLQLWNVPSLADIVYRIGSNAVTAVIKRGQVFQY